MAIELGQLAPEFSLLGSDGQWHALSSYTGQTVVLYFYPRDNTPGCTQEACAFRDLHAEFKEKNAVVLGISKDSKSSHEKFIADFGLPFVLLSDPDTLVMRAYGAFGEKKQYGKIVQGTIRSTVVIGPDGRVIQHWKRVARAATHPAELLAFLRERAG
jgi:peroxiredoxin Q/BCP